MSTNNQATKTFKWHDLTQGCVVLIDMQNMLGSDRTINEYNYPAYHMRVDAIKQNGVNSFLMEGDIIAFLNNDGTPFDQQQFEERIEKIAAKRAKPNHHDHGKSGSYEVINVTHTRQIVSKGTKPIHPVYERQPYENTRVHFVNFVHNEVFRHFNGKMPPNLDLRYLARLLSSHQKGVTEYYGRYGDIRKCYFTYTGGVKNLKKFRAALRRNINRALYNIHSAKIVEDLLDVENVEIDMSRMGAEPRHVQDAEREQIREAFRQMSERWEIFNEPLHDSDRFDRISRPRAEYVNGEVISAQNVAQREYVAIKNKMWEEAEAERKQLEEQGSFYSPSDYIEYDILDHDKLSIISKINTSIVSHITKNDSYIVSNIINKHKYDDFND